MKTTKLLFTFIAPLIFCTIGLSQENVVPREIKNNYSQVNFPNGNIRLNVSPFGFYLESHVDNIEGIECEKSLVEVSRYLYFFLRSIKQRNELRAKCPSYKLNESYFASDYQRGSNKDLEDILRFYFKQKNKKDLTIENYFQVIQRLQGYKKSVIREVLLLHWHFYFNRLDNVRIHLKSFVSFDIVNYLVDLNYKAERQIINDKDGKIRLSQILDELLTLSKSRLEPVIFSTLINYLSQFEWTEVSEEINSKIKTLYNSIDNDDLSTYAKDFRWGKTLPNIWGKLVLERLGEAKLVSYLDEFWKVPEEVKNENLVVPFMEYLYRPKHRNSVLIKLKDLKESKKNGEQRYYFDFVGSKVLAGKRFQGKAVIPARSFQDKRTFYSKIFKSKRWPIFSLYQLISLGDLKRAIFVISKAEYQQPDFYRFAESSLQLAQYAARNMTSPQRVLDLFAGCGVVGRCFIENIKATPELTLVEVQSEFRDSIKSNFDDYPLLNLEQADFRDLTLAPFDLILANPPFYTEGSVRVSPNENKNKCQVRDFEWQAFFLWLRQHLELNGDLVLLIAVKESDQIIREGESVNLVLCEKVLLNPKEILIHMRLNIE